MGLDPSELDKSVTARADPHQPRRSLFGDEYQFMPKHGYTRMFERMLDHPNINIMVQTDYADVKDLVPHRRVSPGRSTSSSASASASCPTARCASAT